MYEDILEKRFGGAMIKPEYAGFKKAKAVILQCPYDKTACYKKGTRNGPEAIIEASPYMEFFDDELKVETYKAGIYTAEPLHIQEYEPLDMINNVKAVASEVYKAEKMPVVIGGEHTVSVGAVAAASQFYKDLSILHLDAHHDVKDEYEGTKYSHACVTRRFLEYAPVVQIGTRSLSKDEHDFMSTNPPNLKTFDVYDILEMALWKENAIKALSDTVYITIDLDVFDPSIMPSVGTPEPGGLGWYEIIDLLRMVAKSKKIVGFDVVELMPIEGFIAPDFIAAKLIYRLLGYTFFGGKK